MTEKNKAIFKEFLRLKWIEVKWFFTWIVPQIILFIGWIIFCGIIVFKIIKHPIEDIFDKIMVFVFGVGVNLVLFIIVSAIYTFTDDVLLKWIKGNWKKAKNNLYPKNKKNLKKK